MKTAVMWIVGLGAAFLLFGFFVGNTPEGQQRSRDRDAIDLCWKDQQRKSLDSGSQRFIAGACERMEADFRTRTGRNP